MEKHLHRLYVIHSIFFSLQILSYRPLELSFFSRIMLHWQADHIRCFWPPWAYLEEHACCDLNAGVAVRQRLVFSNCWSPWLHKHVVCILCHYCHREEERGFCKPKQMHLKYTIQLLGFKKPVFCKSLKRKSFRMSFIYFCPDRGKKFNATYIFAVSSKTYWNHKETRCRSWTMTLSVKFTQCWLAFMNSSQSHGNAYSTSCLHFLFFVSETNLCLIGHAELWSLELS